MLTNPLSSTFSKPSLWDECLLKIREKIGPSHFETWFQTTDLALKADGCACIEVPNQFFADFIEQHFSAFIQEALAGMHVSFSKINFVPTTKNWKIIQPITQSLEESTQRAIPNTIEKKGQFHPNYIFDNFVVGDTNRMAHAAAMAVAEAPGKTSFNPLIIYGGTGLGKTHLLQAIGHFAQREHTADSVFYMTSEEFVNQYIGYVIDKKDSTSFYKKFSGVDLLLIDDVQFFSGKPGTQKEFYRIFNRLFLENKQIVLSSDRPPAKIPDMMHHIINRFLSGLITDIQPPNLEVRMAILRQKAEMDGLSLPENVVRYLASSITSNIRELEGTLIKLIASSSFTGQDITLQITQEIFGDVMARKKQRLSIACIVEKVAQKFDISPNQITAHSRKRDVTLPRNIAMYLCKKWTRQSLYTIGLDFGGRDYSTVIHASKKIEADSRVSAELQQTLKEIEADLQAITAG
ncbi:MAG: chromosomal replication initiator protein DnaA [Chitinivibrionales bacterium]|nr:chromosomal replication initiator protein DnaA [Chitinivibrionales bacterium]